MSATIQRRQETTDRELDDAINVCLVVGVVTEAEAAHIIAALRAAVA